jgi:hypothetical protein
MTDHPDAAILSSMAEDVMCHDSTARAALAAGAAAIRALAQFRPHHPAVVVSSVYAVLHVPFDAMLAAREALGDFDLGRFDVKAAQAIVAYQKADDIAAMTRHERREKFGDL